MSSDIIIAVIVTVLAVCGLIYIGVLVDRLTTRIANWIRREWQTWRHHRDRRDAHRADRVIANLAFIVRDMWEHIGALEAKQAAQRRTQPALPAPQPAPAPQPTPAPQPAPAGAPAPGPLALADIYAELLKQGDRLGRLERARPNNRGHVRGNHPPNHPIVPKP